MKKTKAIATKQSKKPVVQMIAAGAAAGSTVVDLGWVADQIEEYYGEMGRGLFIAGLELYRSMTSEG